MPTHRECVADGSSTDSTFVALRLTLQSANQLAFRCVAATVGETTGTAARSTDAARTDPDTKKDRRCLPNRHLRSREGGIEPLTGSSEEHTSQLSLRVERASD